MTNSLPKWSTSERRQHLIKLLTENGNKCLLGHTACLDASHYVHIDKKTICQKVLYRNIPVRDNNGNLLSLPLYTIRKIEEQVKHVYNLSLADGFFTIRNPNALYEYKSESIIKDWIADTREADRIAWDNERKALHRTNDRTFPLRGRFSSIARDIWHDSQPLFYLEGIGISGLTFKPFAKIRLASSGTRLYIDISNVFKPLSKNARRKAVRYGKSNNALNNDIQSVCYQAVKHYLNS